MNAAGFDAVSLEVLRNALAMLGVSAPTSMGRDAPEVQA